MTDNIEINSEEQQAADFRKDLADLCDQRAANYGFLARMYRVEADAELLDSLRAMRFPASTGNATADSGYRLLTSYLGKVWDNKIGRAHV